MNTPESVISHTTSVCMTRFVKPEMLSGRVLDIGCGSKPYKRLAKEGTEWVGFDIRPVGEVEGDAHELPFADGEFDTVVMTGVLDLCGSPLVAVKEAARVLKSGGHLIASVSNTDADTGEAFWGIRKKGLLYLIHSAGLSTEGVLATGRMFRIEWDNVFASAGPEVAGWLDKMCELFPTVSFAVARKD